MSNLVLVHIVLSAMTCCKIYWLLIPGMSHFTEGICIQQQSTGLIALLMGYKSMIDSSVDGAGPSTPGSTAGRTPLSPSMRRQPLSVHSASGQGTDLAPEAGRVLAALTEGIQADFHTLVSFQRVTLITSMPKACPSQLHNNLS